jgi:hypothetical protein
MGRRNRKPKDFRPFLRRPVAGPIFLALTIVFAALMFLMLRPAHTGTGMADAWQSIMGRPMPNQPNLALTTLFGIFTMGALMLSVGTMPTFVVEVWARIDQRIARNKKNVAEKKKKEAIVIEEQNVRVATEEATRIAVEKEEGGGEGEGEGEEAALPSPPAAKRMTR